MEKFDLKDWVTQYTNELYKWAYSKTSSIETSEDLVQETFLAAAEKLHTFKGESSAKTWLFAILNHKIIDYYRIKVNKPVNIENTAISTFFDDDGNWLQEMRPLDWDEKDGHLLDDYDFTVVLQKCLDALPEKWSTSVKLKYLTEKSGEEICQELGIAPTNFWQIVHRAKLQLRNCIEHNWFKK
jgi:RNA polymerase sigma-70 factor (ECF subfamily)